MHIKNTFKLFKPFLQIILLLLLLAFNVEEPCCEQGYSATDTTRLKANAVHSPQIPENQHYTQPNHHQPGALQGLQQPQEQQRDTLPDLQLPEEKQMDTLPDLQLPEEKQMDTLPDLQLPEEQQMDIQQGQQSDQRRESSFLSSKVDYNATDSMDISVSEEKIFLWGEAYVKYNDIDLRADYIEIDLAKKEVFASGIADSLGNVSGRPVMTEGSETFEAETMRYNFETERGIISGIVTEQEGGFLHGQTTKKHPNDHLHIHDGKYTSCDHEHPHFYIALTRAKVIPGDKVVSGPAYLVIEDIPLPLAVPFGFFPNKPGRTSGVLFPTYGEEVSRGFYLRDGGYYLHLNDYMDLRLMGDIYSLGSWSARASSNYRMRYRFNGSFSYSYSHNVTGERGLANYSENTSYNIAWQHRQDAKASPNSNFSASVNFGSSSFNRFNTYDPDRYAQNTAQSSVSFSHRWPDSPFSLTSNVSANQNFSNQSVNLRLPSVNFNMARQYPFRNPDRIGDPRWYDNVQVGYSSKLDNRLSTYDTLLFKRETLGDMQSGFSHDIPLSANFRFLNLINITPGLTYSGVMYTSSVEKRWVEDYYDPGTGNTGPALVTDTIPGVVYGHSVNPNFSTGFSQNIYGMFNFRDSKVEAVRHVMTPSASFSFTPDMQGLVPDYYRTVQRDTLGNETTYSIFENGMYGTPSIRGRAGSINFSLANNIEMKVRNTRDTISESRKVKILDRLNFSTRYDIYADSLNWSAINVAGNTSLLNNQIRINFNATMDPYALDENFRRYNASEWSVNRSPARITRAGASMTMSLRSAAAQQPMSHPQSGLQDDRSMMELNEDITPGQEEDIFSHLDDIDATAHYYGEYVDFNVPWNLNLRYNINYTKPRNEGMINQTLNFSGDLSLTPRWKIQFSSGYDFRARDFTMTNINIHRDLHCWEMRFGVVPFGSRKSWNFTIQVKSSILKDLKYNTRRSWYDNFFR